MRFHFLVASILVAAVATPAGTADPTRDADLLGMEHASCATAPPCGPITVIITIVLEKSKGITFGDADVFETKGKVSYYFDVDNEGYWYDAAEEMWLEFKVNKEPPWLKTSFTPQKIKVPYRPADGCPDCLRQEGSDPQQMQFYWEGDVAVRVEKFREPTRDELRKWIKSDGTYRVTFHATSNDSMAGTDATGRPAGLMEGYGPKDLRFRPELDSQPVSREPDGLAPMPGLAAIVVAAAAAILLRRRHE